ncbi:MAG: hypothetical protein K2G31_03420 [Clostridia bacterium]|nr:hypothetical protein [Clostridia bacterium]
MSLVASSQKHYRIITLKQLIQQLFKKYKLSTDVHFDVWICGYYPNGNIINKDNPWACLHFFGFNDEKIDGTDVFQWLEFDVEDFEFEITYEYRLYVKLCDINANFKRRIDNTNT